MIMWNYAKLSKAAKFFGGPERLVETIFSAGTRAGMRKMIPFVLLAIPLGMGIQKLLEYVEQKRKASKEELEAAKQELIQGINDYDARQKCNRLTKPTEKGIS